MGEANSWGGWAGVGAGTIWEISSPLQKSAQFCCEPKSAPKKEAYLKENIEAMGCAHPQTQGSLSVP